jgi:hypothetical protein
MTYGIRKYSRSLLITTFVLSVILVSNGRARAQEAASNDPLQPPQQEKFVATDALAIPWRDGNWGCEYGSAVPTPDCPAAAGVAYPSSDILALYNQDGTLWYRFSVERRSPIFWKDNKMGFMPFASHFLLALRLVGESPHWYEVEVNEKNRATKYILKSESRMWSKVTWGFAFSASYSVKINQDRVKLLDKPEGEVNKEVADKKFVLLKFAKLDGDWMYLEAHRNVGLTRVIDHGWIRWRNGRDILVGSVLNDDKVPEPTSDQAENPADNQ